MEQTVSISGVKMLQKAVTEMEYITGIGTDGDDRNVSVSYQPNDQKIK